MTRWVCGLLLAVSLAPVFAVQVGDKAPDFTATLSPSNQFFQLSEHRGKVIYLDFWAAWCGPCRDSMPWLDKLQRRYAKQGFAVIAVNLDEDFNAAARFLSWNPVSYPIIFDQGGVLSKLYQIPGMPTGYLIDRDGAVIDRHVGFRSSKVNAMARAVHRAVTGEALEK